MRRLAILMLLPLTVGVAVAAGTDKDTVTVTFGLSVKSDFALAWPPDHKDTYDVDAATGTVAVPIALRMYLTTVPEGYTSEGTVWEKTYGEEQLTPQGIEDAQGEIQTQQGWPRNWMKDPKAPTWDAGKSQIIMDHWWNLQTLLGRLAKKEKMLNGARMRMGRQKLSADLGGLAFKLHVSVLKTTAPDGKTSVPMAEGYLEWVLPEVTVKLKGACDSQQLITFSVKAPTKDPSEEQTTETRDVTDLIAKLGWPSYALKGSVGYDPVVGFTVPSNGPQGMAGIVVSFEKPDDETKCPLRRPWDWRRLGLLGGCIGGSEQDWVLAPAYKIGSRAHLYCGVAFGNSDNNTSSSVAFGMAFSAGDILGAAVNRKSEDSTATEPTKAKVALAPASTTPVRRERADKLETPAVFLVRGEGLSEMKVAGPIVDGKALAPQTLEPCGYAQVAEGLSEGKTVTGAWGCNWIRLLENEPEASKFWTTSDDATLAYPWAYSEPGKLKGRPFPKSPTPIELRLNNAQGSKMTGHPPLVLKKGIVYFCEIVLPATTRTPPKPPPTGEPQPPTPALVPTGPQWWLRGQAEPRPGQMVSIIITATSEKKVGSGTLQSRTPYRVPAQVDADGFFAVLLPQLEEGRSYRIEITREGSDDQFMVDGVTPEKGKNLPITLPEVRKPAPK